MIQFRLQCEQSHEFDAWFNNSESFDKQSSAGLLDCPVCGSSRISKSLMAPNLGRTKKGDADSDSVKAVAHAAQMRQQLAEIREKVEENCDYVGGEFAEEARKIHYGEADARGIYGETSTDEADALRDEGVPFESVPWLPKENA
jgi:hypothetical protein